MRLAPLTWNLLTRGTASQSTTAAAFSLGKPGSNMTSSDPRQVAEWRGTFTVTAGVNDDLPFTDTGARTPTLTAATYYSPQEMAQHVESVMNGAGGSTAYQVGFSQATSTGFHRFIVYNGSQAFTVDGATSTSTSAWTQLLGFDGTDTSSGNTHIGDYAAVSGTNVVAYDLGDTQPADGCVLVNLGCSPGAVVQIKAGTTSAVSDLTVTAGDHADNRATYIDLGTSFRYRYFQLEVFDPYRDCGLDLRTTLGYLYLGPMLVTDDDLDEVEYVDFDRGGLSREMTGFSAVSRGENGRLSIAEARPGQVVMVPFTGSGVGGNIRAVESVVTAMGAKGRGLLVLDPTDDPHRETALVRLAGMPTYQRAGSGRWTTTLALEVERFM